jgi:NAD(P)-dependent dehydrogenase (short-subunit alcohol dehydrogenase family)
MKTRVYVVTGATSGIGKAIVEILSKDNIVFAGYRSESKGMELGQLSKNIYPFYVDYAKPETIKEAVNYIKTKCEKIDTLINIAGCVVAGPVEQLTMSEVRRQFDVNVFGHVELTQGLLDYLDNGKIINVSSMASFGIFPFISPYCASKRCLDMFFNSLLIENKRNIKIVSVKPGVIVTPLWDKSIKENIALMDNCEGYEKEMNFIAKNAQKNETKGLSVEKVVDVILKADKAKNPKLSYLVGKDAIGAYILSKFPQRIVNDIVRFGLKIRMKKI